VILLMALTSSSSSSQRTQPPIWFYTFHIESQSKGHAAIAQERRDGSEDNASMIICLIVLGRVVRKRYDQARGAGLVLVEKEK